MLETRFSSTTNLAPPGVFNNQFINPPVLIAALKHNSMRTTEGFLYKQMGSTKPQNNSISWIVLSALAQDPKAKCIHPGHKMLHQSCLDFWPLGGHVILTLGIPQTLSTHSSFSFGAGSPCDTTLQEKTIEHHYVTKSANDSKRMPI